MHPQVIRTGLAGLAFALAITASTLAAGQAMNFKAALDGASEVPPVETDATGTLEASYDPATKTLSWTITYEGLSGPPTAAHFHGPAGPGENAPPVVTIEGDLSQSPVEGSVQVTDANHEALTTGRWAQWYLNIHTAANPNGEIRGQVEQE